MERDLVEKLLSQKFVATCWTEASARIAIKAKFRCEYCGEPLYKSARRLFNLQHDHLIPRWAGGKCHIEGDVMNTVHSCNVCNTIKHRFDPRNKLAVPFTGTTPESDEMRTALIDIAREHINDKLQGKSWACEDNIKRYREIIGNFDGVETDR